MKKTFKFNKKEFYKFKAKDVDDYISGNKITKEWYEYVEYQVDKTIEECISIVELLKDDYDTYNERVTLNNAIRHLQKYKSSNSP